MIRGGKRGGSPKFPSRPPSCKTCRGRSSRQVLDRDDGEDLVGPTDANRALVPVDLKDSRLGVVLPDGLAGLQKHETQISGTLNLDCVTSPDGAPRGSR